MKPLILPAVALATSALLGAAAPAVQAQPPAKQAQAAASGGLPSASAEQFQAAQYAHIGTYRCDFGQSVEVRPSPRHPGYIDVEFQKQQMTMRPVLTSTGSLRLEDVRGDRLFLQIANKSMLMDQRAGKRLVDGCVHAAQQRVEAKAAGLLD
ncbi:hypothetical protein [Caldimonas tepidiphila]|uniref:hypothetical protein n=1 Tax=Caldimonas tepidiphila TaxID=2315841 RepID=UPI0013006ED9|nr:hypothetical protein [Caldimonas tepidiphila]